MRKVSDAVIPAFACWHDLAAIMAEIVLDVDVGRRGAKRLGSSVGPHTPTASSQARGQG